MAKTVLTEEERRALKGVALELLEIRKQVNELAEALVKISDKDLLKSFDASPEGVKEKQVDNYKETLEKQIDAAEKEFR